MRIIEAGKESGEIIALQLTENLQRPDLQTLLDELHVFCALVELRIPIAPMPAPEKPVKKKPMV